MEWVDQPSADLETINTLYNRTIDDKNINRLFTETNSPGMLSKRRMPKNEYKHN